MAVFGHFLESMVDHIVPETGSVFWHVTHGLLHFLYFSPHTHSSRMSLIISVTFLQSFHTYSHAHVHLQPTVILRVFLSKWWTLSEKGCDHPRSHPLLYGWLENRRTFCSLGLGFLLECVVLHAGRQGKVRRNSRGGWQRGRRANGPLEYFSAVFLWIAGAEQLYLVKAHNQRNRKQCCSGPILKL